MQLPSRLFHRAGLIFFAVTFFLSFLPLQNCTPHPHPTPKTKAARALQACTLQRQNSAAATHHHAAVIPAAASVAHNSPHKWLDRLFFFSFFFSPHLIVCVSVSTKRCARQGCLHLHGHGPGWSRGRWGGRPAGSPRGAGQGRRYARPGVGVSRHHAAGACFFGMVTQAD